MKKGDTRWAAIGLGMASVALLVCVLGSLMNLGNGVDYYRIFIPILSVYGWIVLLFLQTRAEKPWMRTLWCVLGGMGCLVFAAGLIAFYRYWAAAEPVVITAMHESQGFPADDLYALQHRVNRLEYYANVRAATWAAALRVCAALVFPMAVTGIVRKTKRCGICAAVCAVGIGVAMTQVCGTVARVTLDLPEEWHLIALTTGAVWLGAAVSLRDSVEKT